MDLWNTDLYLGIHLNLKKHNKGDYVGHCPILCKEFKSAFNAVRL